MLSLELDDVVDAPPRWPVRWGAALVLGLLVAGAVIAAHFQFPETVHATVSLTTAVAPSAVAPRTDGRLDSIFVADRDTVAAGDPIALVENAAHYGDVRVLEGWIDRAGPLEIMAPPRLTIPPVPASLIVGDMQESYLSLAAKVRAYNETLADTLPSARVRAVARELDEQAALEQALAATRASQDSVRVLAASALDRQRQLAENRMTSAAELEAAKSAVFQQDIAVRNAEFNLHTAQGRKEELRGILIAALSEHRTALALSWSDLLASFARLRHELRAWDEAYVIRAPTAGQVTFLDFLGPHSTVRRGVELLAIVSPDTAVVVEAVLPQTNAGRLRAGQSARIELAGYPARDAGYLDAQVADVGLMPRDSLLLVHLRLTKGLSTSFGRRLEFRQRMLGTAEITMDHASVLRHMLNGARLLAEKH